MVGIVHAYYVDTGYGERFVRVDPDDTHEAYRDMEAFIETVGSERRRERLWDAIAGRDAFRRFTDVLAAHPDERER